MNVVMHSSPLGPAEAADLKHAAIGAANIARESGDADMSEKLMTRARAYNRAARRKGREALPVPAVKDMQTVKAAELQDPVKAVVKELARMGKLGEWRIIGEANAADEPFRPLCARQVGKAVRYMELPAPVQAKASRTPAKKSTPKESKVAEAA
ncbi:hypothetical protein [Streptomyces sp. Midd1]|uniref:hypothetical protein n=1 Tax=Streptomyces sp. Midd3 TaxID=3161191 RepID=UPI0034DB6020